MTNQKVFNMLSELEEFFYYKLQNPGGMPWNILAQCKQPHTAEDAQRQLCALNEIRTHRAEYNAFTGGHISKRHNRPLKQYRAFCAMEG